MRGVLSILAAATALAVVGCEKPEPVSFTHESVLAKAGLETYWQLDLELQEGERVERVFLLDENLYCLTNTNYVLTVDAARGVRTWAHKIAPEGVQVYEPCHAGNAAMSKELPDVLKIRTPPAPETLPAYDVVMFNTPGYVEVLDRGTGDRLRRITFDDKPLHFTANTGGCSDGTWFYVGSAAGNTYAIRLNTAVISWIHQTEQVLTARPRCHAPGGSGRVFVGGQDGEFYVLKAGPVLAQAWPPSGTRDWPAMAGPVVADFHVDDRGAFIPCVNRRVYRFPLSGGEPTWWFTAKGALMQPVQVSENTVFQYAEQDALYALDPSNGRQRWKMADGRRVLATMRVDGVPLAYLVTEDRKLCVVDEVLGKVKAAIPLTGVDLYADNTGAPAIYLATHDGQLRCLRPEGSGRLTADVLKGKGGS